MRVLFRQPHKTFQTFYHMKLTNIEGQECDSCFPADGLCPVCKREFKLTGFAFLTFGAFPCSKDGSTVLTKQLFHLNLAIGFHGNECSHPELIKQEASESYMSETLIELVGKQNDFEFAFCSFECLKDWFANIFDEFSDGFQKKFGFIPGPNPATPVVAREVSPDVLVQPISSAPKQQVPDAISGENLKFEQGEQ